MKREKLDRLGEILQESVNKHEIAGGNLLVMHHGEYPVGALRSLKQLAYVFCINADRLIADQMLSGL